MATGDEMTGTELPLAGVRVIEMTHMVMGPTCGMILAQLGAEIIKVEPPAGDKPGRHGHVVLSLVQPRQKKRRARLREG
jgi:crotonobetainyl-CoA:carnitine CoA-transferase CaiB-like acyl-CoA transferase